MAPPGSWWELRSSPPRHEVVLQRRQPSCGGSGELAGWVPWSAALSFPPRAGLVTGTAGPGLSAGGEGGSENAGTARSGPWLIIFPPGPQAALSPPCAALWSSPDTFPLTIRARRDLSDRQGDPSLCGRGARGLSPLRGRRLAQGHTASQGWTSQPSARPGPLVCSLLQGWRAKPCRLSPRVSHAVPHTRWGGFHTFLSFNQSS